MKNRLLSEETIHRFIIESLNEIFKKPSNDILKLGPTTISTYSNKI